MSLITIRVNQLEAGDIFPGHYVVDRIVDVFGVITAHVTFTDGGTGRRTWDDPSIDIEVDRPSLGVTTKGGES